MIITPVLELIIAHFVDFSVDARKFFVDWVRKRTFVAGFGANALG